MSNHRTFADDGGRGGNGTGGVVDSVTAANASVVIGGTIADPTVRANLATTVPDIGPNEGVVGVALTERRGDAIPGQKLVAQWPIGTATRRYYAVDFVNGNDANAGFSDVSMAGAGAVAKKTVAGLAAIFPKTGAGRAAEIAFRNGGVNTVQAYAADLFALVLSGVQGYANGFPIVRGTGTNPTAGAVAFAGNIADVTYAGAVTCTGCNAAGYNPIGAPTNQIIKLAKVGGAAAALPAEPLAPLGWRIRFDSATTTVALRNVCRTVVKVSTTTTANDTILLNVTLPAVPGLTDTFYLEQAGVTFTGGQLVQCQYGGGNGATTLRGMQLLGLLFTTAVTVISSGVFFEFCGCTLSMSLSQAVVSTEYRCIHPLGTLAVGGAMHVGTTCTSNSGGILSFQAAVWETGPCQFANPVLFRWSQGSVAGQGFALFGYNGGDQSSVCSVGAEGVESATPCRVLASNGTTTAGIIILNSKLPLGFIDVTGVGARPGIALSNSIAYQISSGGGTALSGSTGNTNYGMAFLTTGNGSAYYGNANVANTLTGTSGDIRAFSPAGTDVVVTWAQSNATGFSDGRGNRIVVVNSPTGAIKFSGAIVPIAGGATTSYLADTGAQLIAANLGAQRYPTSLRLVTRLRVTKLVGAGVVTNNITCTLYKNGVATAMSVSILAADAQFTKYANTATAVLFADGDDYDLRLDDAADVLHGVLTVSAVLEYSV